MIVPRYRIFESALADVRYVFGAPIRFPSRADFKSDSDYREHLKSLGLARERAIDAALDRQRQLAEKAQSGSDCQSETRE